MKKTNRLLALTLAAMLACPGLASADGTLILPAELKIIEEEAFCGSDSIGKVIVPDGAAEIRARAFADSSLTEIEIPASVSFIADDAFDGCGEFTVSAEEGSYAAGWWENLQNMPLPADDFEYEISGGEVTITYYTGDSGRVIVPAEIGGYPVTAIGERAFFREEDVVIRSVVLPEGVAQLGEGAFLGCSGLTEISLPSSLRAIGAYAFCDCTRLKEIALPASLTALGEYAFSACSALRRIELPASLTALGELPFNGCNGLESVCVDENNPAFASADGVLFSKDLSALLFYPAGRPDSEYAVPEGTAAIGESAFEYCFNLLRVTLPDTVTSIGDWAFCGCRSLLGAYIPAGVTQIGEGAFDECNVLTLYGAPGSAAEDCAAEHDIPFSADAMSGDDATPAGCFDYTIENGEATINRYTGSSYHIVIPAEIEGCPVTAVESIRSEYEIYSLTIPASVESIAEGAIMDAGKISVDPASAHYTVAGGVLFTKDMSVLVYYPDSGSAVSYEIPEGVKRIGAYAMASGHDLQSIAIPDSVTEIGEYAFNWCYSLKSLVIPDSVTEIGAWAFYGCYGMTSLVIGGGISEIPDGAFSGCDNLAEAVIPEGVTRIGMSAFETCFGLKRVSLPASLTEIGENAFDSCNSLEAYEVADGCAAYASHEGVLLTADMKTLIACPPAKASASYAVPDGVERIAAKAFLNSGIEEISLPGTLKDIGASAFRNTGLRKVNLPAGVTGIGEYCFSRCENLESVTLPDSLASIPEYAFDNCVGLISIEIPGSVSEVADFAFDNCSSLMSVKIGSGVTSLGYYAFDSCYGLAGMYIPASVTAIDDHLFGHYLHLSEGFRIYGEAGSAAETFASDNGLAFTAGSMPDGIATPANDFQYEISGGEATIRSYDGNASVVIIPSEIEGCPVTGIAYHAFYHTERIVIPAGVTRIEEGAFQSADRLEIDAANPAYVISDGALYSSDMKLLLYAAGAGPSFTVPDGVTRIGSYAFCGVEGLVCAVLPDSVTEIGDHAFAGSHTLRKVRLSENLVSIGDSAFRECLDLTGIALPEGLEYIGADAFNDCYALTQITIPASVSAIGETAFLLCASLKRIDVFPGSAVYASADGVLFTKDMSTLIVCPEGRKAGVYAVPDGVTAISDFAFYGNSGLLGAVLPDGLTSIGACAFAYCSGMTRVNIPDTVTAIGESAFIDCSCLTEISIPGSVNSIPESAFTICSSIESLTIGEGSETIGSGAFSGCSGLRTVTLPASLRSIAEDAFDSDGGFVAAAPEGSYAAGWAVENGFVAENAVLESAHPYESDSEEAWTYVHPEEAAALRVTFSKKSKLEDGCDYLYITDSLGETTQYTGAELSGAVLTLPGSSFSLKLVTDHSIGYFGFRITKIEPLSAEEYNP